jgi:hypothetical protein
MRNDSEKVVSREVRAMRRFYLHKRAGIYYAELVNQSTGKKLPAKSTGERDKDEARDIVREWLRTGIPSSPTRKPRPAEEVFTLASILSGIHSANLTPTDAEKIAEAMKARCCMDVDLREAPWPFPDLLAHEAIRDDGLSRVDQREACG